MVEEKVFMMKIDEIENLISRTVNQSITIIKKEIIETIRKPINPIANSCKKYSRNEVARIFDKTYQTIITWEKQGYLIPISEVSDGGKIRYFYSSDNIDELKNKKGYNTLLSA